MDRQKRATLMTEKGWGGVDELQRKFAIFAFRIRNVCRVCVCLRARAQSTPREQNNEANDELVSDYGELGPVIKSESYVGTVIKGRAGIDRRT